jgi:hypothetical protein
MVRGFTEKMVEKGLVNLLLPMFVVAITGCYAPSFWGSLDRFEIEIMYRTIYENFGLDSNEQLG